ncbi:hypothetical protein ICN41_04455 [Polynucleobacter sp. 15G-AUS-farblos]|uniref:hypothetical protein n=1 Tax=Polynucleobacter sp. 15G-AUS-farblos TaxID=2689094 RepID=UPI001C0CAD6E|nr:hypothetical protein [Polynucleobacter sp. 15G-AUS-farblos]MBU3583240.1 hypothetical protein [Polynucleobacter sp. 15G-AUS-farblos]
MKRLQAFILSKYIDTTAQLDLRFRQSRSALRGNKLASSFLTPIRFSQSLSYLLICFTAAASTFWLMHVIQIPAPEDTLLKSSKGTSLYINQDLSASYPLFGSKPLATDNIILRGVVVTEKTSSGVYQGFALFDIDGKPSGAIAVGETIDRGMTLKSIDTETATLLYQGKEMGFSVQKSKKDSAPSSRSSEIKKARN